MPAIAMFETMSSPVLDGLKVLVRQIGALHTRHSERLMIRALLKRSPRHLDDMGISAADLREALDSPTPSRTLAARRTQRAAAWYRLLATA